MELGHASMTNDSPIMPPPPPPRVTLNVFVLKAHDMSSMLTSLSLWLDTVPLWHMTCLLCSPPCHSDWALCVSMTHHMSSMFTSLSHWPRYCVSLWHMTCTLCSPPCHCDWALCVSIIHDISSMLTPCHCDWTLCLCHTWHVHYAHLPVTMTGHCVSLWNMTCPVCSPPCHCDWALCVSMTHDMSSMLTPCHCDWTLCLYHTWHVQYARFPITFRSPVNTNHANCYTFI